MGLLLYKSNEMFSSTELIRKSKTIFNKIIDNEIDKAVIMRDGKPGFLLMDFQKYEAIMQEFEDLKEKEKNNNQIVPKPKLETKVQPIVEVKTETKIELENKNEMIEEPINTQLVETQNIIEEQETEVIEKEIVKVKPAHVVPPRPQMIVEQECTIPNDDEDTIVENKSSEPETPTEEEEEYEEPSEEEEINTALERIKSMNFDDTMRALAEKKIKEKILRARKERAIRREQEELLNKQDLKEELELQVHIKEQNKKKERELREFWD